MKKISELTGFKVLSKKEQSEINGAISRPYCKGNNQCCVRVSPTFEFCDYGYCQGFGQCIWA